jgi:hypothetical protein
MPRVGLDRCGKSRPPARSELLYQLRYYDPPQNKFNTKKSEAKSGYNWTTQVYIIATPLGSVEKFRA